MLLYMHGCYGDYSGGREVFTIAVGKVLMVVVPAVAADSSLSQSGVDTTMVGVATHPW